MAEPEEGGLEKKVDEGATGGIFDSISKSLDNLGEAIVSIPSAVKETTYYTYYGAKAALGATAGLAMGGPQSLIMPAGMIAGRETNYALTGQKRTFKERFKEWSNLTLVGSLLGGYLHYTFKGVQYLGNIVSGAFGKIAGIASKALFGLAGIPPFMYLHEGLDRLFDAEHKPQDPMEKMKEKAGPLALLSLPIAANYSITPPALKLPVAGGISWLYGAATTPKQEKEEQKMSPELARQMAQQQQYG